MYIGEVIYWKRIQEDHEFIVTRATIVIALHLLHTVHPAAPQSVWVLTTHVTYSTKYRRSGYVPGFSTRTKQKQKESNKKKNPKTPIIPIQKQKKWLLQSGNSITLAV
jgi:hypothetical protein